MLVLISAILMQGYACKKDPVPPILKTEPASLIENTKARLNGSVNPNNIITKVFFEYGTTNSFERSIPANEASLSGSSTSNVFADLTGLLSGQVYYYRIKSENSVGIVYGDEQTFTTSVKDYDGNSYTTVQIGNQVWMKENLKVTVYPDGTPITLITNSSSWSALSSTNKVFCWPNDLIQNKDVYGALYTWQTAINGDQGSEYVKPSGIRGVCPDGWHVPNNAEWDDLTGYLGGINVAGGKLKENGTTHWNAPNTFATNESGFTGMPAGFRYGDGTFSQFGASGQYWSSSKPYYSEAYRRMLWYQSGGVSTGSQSKYLGLSVRCIRDY